MLTPEMLDKVAWLGLPFVQMPITGIMIRFAGLGWTERRTGLDGEELALSPHGVLTVAIYHDPWAWMNRRTQQLVDDVIEATRARHNLGPEIPLIATGNSMGGHAALLYAIRARQKVAACFASCPACDLVYHYNERPDVPRTMHHAYDYYGSDIEPILKEHSPLHLVDALPDIPYFILHGQNDHLVKREAHSEPMVAAMRKRGLNVEYMVSSIMTHCGPQTYESHRRQVDFILSNIPKRLENKAL